RARAARLRREAQAQAAKAAAETSEADEHAADDEPAETDDEVSDSVEATDADDTETTQAQTKEAAKEAEPNEEAAEETAEDAESESKARSRRRLRLPSWSVAWKAAVIALICAFVAASGYMMWERHQTSERNQRIANFLAAARQGVVNMTSLDFNKAKEDVQRVIDSSTGQFRDDFQQRAKDFTTVVEQSKVVTQGTVNAAAVQSIDGNSALVLVAATSRITNAAGAKDEPRNWRLKVTVTDEGGQYKMSKLEFVP
ncbi:hypothetical protein O983_17045, partial [Mycobacterium avium 09-5983]